MKKISIEEKLNKMFGLWEKTNCNDIEVSEFFYNFHKIFHKELQLYRKGK